MTATYTWDVFSTQDGYGSYQMAAGDIEWGGYWGKQRPQLLERRAEIFAARQRMFYGATTFREVAAAGGLERLLDSAEQLIDDLLLASERS